MNVPTRLHFTNNTDNEKPIISGLPSNITKLTGHPSVAVSWTNPMATDNSGIQTLTSNHSSGSMFPLGSTTVVYTSVDPYGNMMVQSFDVIVKGKRTAFHNLTPGQLGSVVVVVLVVVVVVEG